MKRGFRFLFLALVFGFACLAGTGVSAWSAKTSYETSLPISSEPVFTVKNQTKNKSYLRLEQALGEATSGDFIYLLRSTTLTKTATIPVNATLLIPYSQDNLNINSSSNDMPYANTANNGNNSGLSAPADAKTALTLTIESNVILTVSAGAKLVVGGQFSGNQPIGGETYGFHGDIEIKVNSSIVGVGDSSSKPAIISTYGYIYGAGTLKLTQYCKLYEPFVVTDYHGGTFTAVSYKTYTLPPFNSYSLPNIRTGFSMTGTSKVYGYCSLFASSAQNTSCACAVGVSGDKPLLVISESTRLETEYDNSAGYSIGSCVFGKKRLRVMGNANFGYLSLDAGTTVQTSDVVMPVCCGFDIEIVSGTFSVDNHVALFPGATLVVDRGATFKISGKKCIGLDGIKCQVFSGGSAYNNGTFGYRTNGTERSRFINNGTFIISNGSVFTGIIETTSNTGTIQVDSSVSSFSYDLVDGIYKGDQYGIFGSAAGTTSRTVHPVSGRLSIGGSLTPLEKGTTYYGDSSDGPLVTTFTRRLYNDSKELASTESVSLSAAERLHGNWTKSTSSQLFLYKYSYNNISGINENLGSESETIKTISSTLTVSGGELPLISKVGYVFEGWYVDSLYNTAANGYEIALSSSSITTIQIYAKWRQLEITFVFSHDEHATGTMQPIGPFHYGDSVTLPSGTFDVDADYSFYAWQIQGTSYVVPAGTYSLDTGSFSLLKSLRDDVAIPLVALHSKNFQIIVTRDEFGVGDNFIPSGQLGGSSYTIPEYSSLFSPLEGYEFSHWEVNGSTTKYASGDSVLINQDTTIRAVHKEMQKAYIDWSINDENISFESGVTLPEWIYVGKQLVLPAASVVNTDGTGKVMTKWNVNGTQYDPGASIAIDSLMLDSGGRLPVIAITEYKMFSLTVTISKGSSGDSAKDATITVSYYSDFLAESVTTRTFSGQTLSADNSVSIPKDREVSITVDYSAVAATINANGETVTKTTGQNYRCSATTDITVSATSTPKSCLLPDTLITMADGSQKAVKSIIAGELVRVFNHETGELDVVPVILNDHDPAELRDVIHLEFSNGESIGVIDEHAFFDLDTMRYEYVTKDSYEALIGHRFYGESGEATTLTQAYISTEYTECYSPISYYHFDYFTEGILSMPGGISGFINIFEYGETLRYDQFKMQEDIATYGLFTYEDLAPLGVTEEMFAAYAGQYLKVAMGKGLLTEEVILYLINRYYGSSE